MDPLGVPSKCQSSVTLKKLGDFSLGVSLYNQMYHTNVVATLNRAPLTMLSCCPDKSGVHAMGLFSSVYALPSNEAWWGAPQAQWKHASGETRLGQVVHPQGLGYWGYGPGP